MRLQIRPGKVTCAGVVAILMVLPNSIWSGWDAKVASVPKPRTETSKKASDSEVRSVKLRKMAN